MFHMVNPPNPTLHSVFITLKLRIIFNVYARSESLNPVMKCCTMLYTSIFFECNLITLLYKHKKIFCL